MSLLTHNSLPKFNHQCMITTLLVVIALVFVAFKSLSWCANYTDTVGKLYARLFIWLQETCGLTLVRARLNSIEKTNKDAQTFIGSYSKWFYWVMCLDEYRMRAYQNSIRALVNEGKGPTVWLDVGAGAHTPLTLLILKYLKYVHAVESNGLTFKCATALKRTLEVKTQDRITLHNCYSTELDATAIEPQPEAVIHDIVGTVASNEGAVSAIRDVFRRFPRVTRMIPRKFSTLCVPVSRPTVSFTSSLASIFFGGAWYISEEAGVQCLYNPSRSTWMSTPASVEEYGVAEMKTSVHGNKGGEKSRVFSISRSDYCVGLFFSPLINCSDHENDEDTTIHGLLQNTNWGVEYVSFGREGIYLEAGDQLKVNFVAHVDGECPTYSVDVLGIRKVYLGKPLPQRLSATQQWKGPQDNMLL